MNIRMYMQMYTTRAVFQDFSRLLQILFAVTSSVNVTGRWQHYFWRRVQPLPFAVATVLYQF